MIGEFLLQTFSYFFQLGFIFLLIETFGFEKIRGKIYLLISLGIFLICHSAIYYFYVKNLDIFPIFIYPIMYLLLFYFMFGRIKFPSIYISIISEFIIVLLASSFTFAFINSTNISQQSLSNVVIFLIRLVLFIASICIRKNKKLRNISLISHDIPNTVKSNKKEHGFGLYNIKNVVDRSGGNFKILCENNIFNLTVLYKL